MTPTAAHSAECASSERPVSGSSVTGTSRRILPDNHRHIDEYGFLPGNHSNRDEAPSGDAEAKAAVTGFYLVIAQPGETHLVDLMVGAIAGERQAVVLAGIDGLAFVRLTSRDVVRHRIVADIVNAYERAAADPPPA